MKITCDNCGAKYSIADEKVKGKVFKIRCKKCSHIVVVRGTTAGEEPAGVDRADDPAREAGVAASAESAEDKPKWHVVVGREQVGPCTVADVRERFAHGEITGESYVWREGFADWMRLAAVDEFSDLVQSADDRTEIDSGAVGAAEGAQPMAATTHGGLAAVAQEPNAGGFEPEAAVVASLGAGEDDLAMQQSQAGSAVISGGNGHSAGIFSAAAVDGANRPLFADDQGEDEGVDLAHPQMTGQRGENSVLFSLANLQALAMGGASPAAPGAGMSTGPASTGEGSSGLIDIRAMAASAVARGAADEDLPVLSGFSGPVAAAPVLLPSASSDRPAWLLPTLVGLGVLFVGAIVLLVVVLTKSPGASVSTATRGSAVPAETTAVAAAAQVPAPQVGERQPAAAPDEPSKAGASSASADTAAATDVEKANSEGEEADSDSEPAEKNEARASASVAKRSPRRRPRRGVRGGRRVVSQSSPVRSSEPVARPAARASGPRDELDKLLDSSMAGGGRRSRGAGERERVAADSDLPQRLSRGQIVKGMSDVKGRVQSCYDRYKVPGLADVRLKIANTGGVQSARVKGLFAGTPTGSCVENAVKAARFPRFKVASMSITYPFMLR